MNKIVLEKNSITEKKLDDSIILKLEENKVLDVKTLNINIIKDTDLKIIQRSKEKIKLDIIININKNVKCNLLECKENGNYKESYKYNLEESSHINIIKINDVKKIKELNIFNLNGKHAKVNYIVKTIAKDEEKYDVLVYHNKGNTESNIINHGVNIKDGKIKFDVSGFVPNKTTDCTLNQNNQIINLTNNKCEIKPNLFIDENDVIANHSAHIGKCDENKLFYLKSRGITEKNAESLIIKGFLNSKINEKDIMEKLINKYWR